MYMYNNTTRALLSSWCGIGAGRFCVLLVFEVTTAMAIDLPCASAHPLRPGRRPRIGMQAPRRTVDFRIPPTQSVELLPSSHL